MPKSLDFPFNCPNPTQSPDCNIIIYLKDKYSLKYALRDNNRLCKSCGSIKMVETRRKNDSYKTTEQAKENISKGLKKSYEITGYVVWNKGLSAETDERVAKTGKSRPGELNPMFGTSYKEIWKSEYSDQEFNDKFNYNAYLKSQSSLTFEEWFKLREENRNAYHEYKREVWRYTVKNPIKSMLNYEKRGKAGIEGAYQLDHLVSIKYGFEHNIDPKHIGSMENLKFIPWEVNNRKKSSIVLMNYSDEQAYSFQYSGFGTIVINLLKSWGHFELPKLIKIK